MKKKGYKSSVPLAMLMLTEWHIEMRKAVMQMTIGTEQYLQMRSLQPLLKQGSSMTQNW